MAWFDLNNSVDYEQFLGRSNREVPVKLQQRGAIIVDKVYNVNEFEASLK